MLGGVVRGGHFPYVITKDFYCILSHFRHFFPPYIIYIKFGKFYTFFGEKIKVLELLTNHMENYICFVGFFLKASLNENYFYCL